MAIKAPRLTKEDHRRSRINAALLTLFNEARSSEQALAVERLRKVFEDSPSGDDGSETVRGGLN